MIKGGEREKERKRHEQALSGNRFPMDASMAELSSFRPFEPNGEQHPWHVIWDNIPCDQKGSVLHEHNLLYEVVLTVQCTFVPISASTFCPSHTSASKPHKTTCVSQRRRRRANRIHPLWSKIRRHATTTDDDPLSCRRRLSPKLLGKAFSHHFPLDLSLFLSPLHENVYYVEVVHTIPSPRLRTKLSNIFILPIQPGSVSRRQFISKKLSHRHSHEARKDNKPISDTKLC